MYDVDLHKLSIVLGNNENVVVVVVVAVVIIITQPNILIVVVAQPGNSPGQATREKAKNDQPWLRFFHDLGQENINWTTRLLSSSITC